MHALAVTENRFTYSPSAKGVTVDANGQNWLVLMQLEADDRFGNLEKHSGAFMVDRNFQLDSAGPRERVTFDSTINCLPVDFYANAAGLTELAFVAQVNAPEWRVQVFERIGNKLPNLIGEVSGEGRDTVTLPIAFRRNKGARISVTLTYRGEMESNLLAFVTPSPEQMQPMGLSITTYNKPEYVLHNLNVIRASRAYKAGLIDLLIVNNGNPIEGLADDIAVITPGNVGGTGGFQVGAAHFTEKGLRHFVIMDDDIVIPADSVDRFFALSCFVKGHHVGSLAEIENTAKRLVKEQGADVARRDIFGINLKNPMIDIHSAERTNLYAYQECDYSGWWALMVDLEAATQVKLPSYFFIKRDDISFGLESRRNGTPTVVFPNILVAHSEEGAASYMYYDVRNDLVMRSRNNDALGMSIKGLSRILVTKFLIYRLEEQRMFNQALVDYMKGPKFLASRPVGDTLRDVRALAGKRIAIPEDHPVLRSEKPVSTLRMLSAWVRPSAWRTPNPLPLVPADNRACVTEIGGYISMSPFSKTGIIYKRSFANITALLRGIYLLGRFAMTRRKTIARYQEAK